MATTPSAGSGEIHVNVKTRDGIFISDATVALVQISSAPGIAAAATAAAPASFIGTATTHQKNRPACFDKLPDGDYEVILLHHSDPMPCTATVKLSGKNTRVTVDLVALDALDIDQFHETDDGTRLNRIPRVGEWVHLKIDFNRSALLSDRVHAKFAGAQKSSSNTSRFPVEFWKVISAEGIQDQKLIIELDPIDPTTLKIVSSKITSAGAIPLSDLPTRKARFSMAINVQAIARDITPVAMSRTETEPTADMRLWAKIRASTEALSFGRYAEFIEHLISDTNGGQDAKRFGELTRRRYLPFTDSDAYRVLKAATEAFVMVNCGIVPTNGAYPGDTLDYLDRRDLPGQLPPDYFEHPGGRGEHFHTLPYLGIIRRKLGDLPMLSNRFRVDGADIDLDDGFIEEKLKFPCLLELIWSYWHEEGMQVQAMNAISRRFQNMRSGGPNDPLANMEINPLRPLNNLIWSYIQDEQHRLTVVRRNYEYDHHYGLRLEGRAVQDFRPADTRSKFIEAFHELLRLCSDFYKQDDDTTVKADAFGVLNALKEVHLILSQGAHSQFGDLPATARIEMLMQQWLLARPEFREFLPTRVMVAYPEPWMDRVDAMKKLQGWTDTSVMHFHNLAVFGEQILLSIRYGNWSSVFEPTQAFNFTRFWRPQIQGYIHAYRAATGVELGAPTVSARVDATLPSVLLQRRLQTQQRIATVR